MEEISYDDESLESKEETSSCMKVTTLRDLQKRRQDLIRKRQIYLFIYLFILFGIPTASYKHK
jgi:hypothetical protein